MAIDYITRTYGINIAQNVGAGQGTGTAELDTRYDRLTILKSSNRLFGDNAEYLDDITKKEPGGYHEGDEWTASGRFYQKLKEVWPRHFRLTSLSRPHWHRTVCLFVRRRCRVIEKTRARFQTRLPLKRLLILLSGLEQTRKMSSRWSWPYCLPLEQHSVILTRPCLWSATENQPNT